MEQYKYYSTQRPIGPGTFPKPTDNPPTTILNYDCDQRVPVESGAFSAWGDLTYGQPLTPAQMNDYELRPASDNPDIRRAAERQAVRAPHTKAGKSTRDHNDR